MYYTPQFVIDMKPISLLVLLLVVLGFGCSKENFETMPSVATTTINDITSTSALVDGVATYSSKTTIVEQGICYSINPMPTVVDKKIASNVETVKFSINLTALSPKTTYYVRAYAIISSGKIFYGKQNSFSTINFESKVTTLPVNNLTSVSAIGGGILSFAADNIITEQGVCYGTTSMPTVANKKIASTDKTNSFSVKLIDLTPKTTYYARAYALSSTGAIFYGQQISFTTSEASAAGEFTDVQYSYTTGTILYNGVHAYSYTSGCNLYLKSIGGEFKIESFGTLRVYGGTSKGQSFRFTVKASQIEIGKEYSLNVTSSGETANDNWANFANPTEQDSYFYLWNNDMSKVIFSVFTPKQIKGKIKGKFVRPITGMVSDAEVSFDFTK
jgi:hypothetical protein